MLHSPIYFTVLFSLIWSTTVCKFRITESSVLIGVWFFVVMGLIKRDSSTMRRSLELNAKSDCWTFHHSCNCVANLYLNPKLCPGIVSCTCDDLRSSAYFNSVYDLWSLIISSCTHFAHERPRCVFEDGIQATSELARRTRRGACSSNSCAAWLCRLLHPLQSGSQQWRQPARVRGLPRHHCPPHSGTPRIFLREVCFLHLAICLTNNGLTALGPSRMSTRSLSDFVNF